MTKVSVFQAVVSVALFTFGVVTGLVAQTTGDSPQRVEQK